MNHKQDKVIRTPESEVFSKDGKGEELNEDTGTSGETLEGDYLRFVEPGDSFTIDSSVRYATQSTSNNKYKG